MKKTIIFFTAVFLSVALQAQGLKPLSKSKKGRFGIGITPIIGFSNLTPEFGAEISTSEIGAIPFISYGLSDKVIVNGGVGFVSSKEKTEGSFGWTATTSGSNSFINLQYILMSIIDDNLKVSATGEVNYFSGTELITQTGVPDREVNLSSLAFSPGVSINYFLTVNASIDLCFSYQFGLFTRVAEDYDGERYTTNAIASDAEMHNIMHRLGCSIWMGGKD
jgi:hypothetical protein